jgi:hypothetical protein
VVDPVRVQQHYGAAGLLEIVFDEVASRLALPAETRALST